MGMDNQRTELCVLRVWNRGETMRVKRITRTRYYCDFCEAAGRLKGFWSKPSIIKHERGCTANPDRVCGLCASAIPPLQQRPINELIACLSTEKENFGLADLRAKAENCPACILAAIRQSGIQGINENGIVSVDFDFKREYQDFWNTVNAERLKDDCY